MRKRAHSCPRVGDGAMLNLLLVDAIRELLGLRPLTGQEAFDRSSSIVSSWVEVPPGRLAVEGGYRLRSEVIGDGDGPNGRRSRVMRFVVAI